MNSDAGETLWLDGAEPSGKRHPRIAMAHWITDAKHGAGHLLARVMVNRLWQHHFGVGIVATPSDFGQQGARPSHPELLDYLARKLIEGGWKLKPIHKQIILSAVYQQVGQTNEAALKLDPDNQLWWRRPPQRMEAEIIRDNLLAVSGSLDLNMYGPGSLNESDARRSVYLKVKRGSFDSDFATVSTRLTRFKVLEIVESPPSAPGARVDELAVDPEMAEKLANRVQKENGGTTAGIVETTFWTVLSRAPSAAERDHLAAFIKTQAASYGNDAKAMNTAVADYCQLMLCLNEFVYVD